MSTNHAELLNQLRGGLEKTLGMEYTLATLEEVVAEVEIGPQHSQPYGLVHGGVYCALIESVCSAGAAMSAMAKGGGGAVGLDNQTSFLRGAEGKKLIIRATPLSTGRRTHLWQADVHDETGAHLAEGRVRLLVTRRGEHSVKGLTKS